MRDRTLQLVLARLLDIEDPELPRALSRLVDLLTPSMAAEEVSLGRRKQAQVHESDTSGGRSMPVFQLARKRG